MTDATAIKRKYLEIARSEIAEMWIETNRLLANADSMKEQYKIMDNHWVKIDKLLAKINLRGLAEIAQGKC